jgi:hypothetical protein
MLEQVEASAERKPMTQTTGRAIHHAARDQDVARQLQATRFRLMTELGCGTTPMRLVNESFERACSRLGGTHIGPGLPMLVERAVRAELNPTRLAIASVA